ncbi:MAG: acetolactate synthase large subunit [bacterium]
MQGKHKNTAEVLVEGLEAHGVKYIFGVPGEENLAFLEAIRTSRIKFVTTRHEAGAAFMAATVGRMTGKIGVALSTLGPGATNLMTGAAYAQLGGFPLLLITGQKPIRKSKQGKFQIVGIVGMMKPVTKYSATVVDGEKISSMLSEAITLAESVRPGAVHLELPEDVAEEVCSAGHVAVKKILNMPAAEQSVAEALREIEKAKHPIVILGNSANNSNLDKSLKAFFKKTKIPFVSTQMGKGSLDESSELYIGTTAIAKGDLVHKALVAADVVVLIGHDVINTPPMILTPEVFPNLKIIHVNYYSSSAKDVYIPTLEVVGDISKTLSAFTKNIKVSSAWDFSYFFKVRDELKQDIAKFADSKDFPLHPYRIVSDLNKTLPADGALALDNGMYKIYIGRNFITKEQNSLLLDNALATMGAGLPSGIALKVLYPKKKVVVVAGDGGFMMSISDLETAVRLKIDLVVLVLDDSGYGMISWKQKKMKFPSFAISFKNPDFVKLAESFGAKGYEVKKAADLSKLLERALNAKGVHIIHCPINYQQANKFLGQAFR